MSRSNVKWLAGMFEGEGIIYISEPNDRTVGVLQVALGNTDKSLVEPFNERYEGTIKVNNPNRPDNWAKCWKWEAHASSAVEPLEELKPHFVSEKWTQRAELALEIQELKDWWVHCGKKTEEKGKRYRNELEPLVNELRELNAKGPDDQPEEEVPADD